MQAITVLPAIHKKEKTMQVAEIKSYLKKHKITYEELSEKSGIPLGTLKNIFSKCSTNPRLDTMQAIENALGLSKPLEWTDEDYANGVTDSVRLDLNTREFEWHELGNEVYAKKGEDYYNVLRDMIKAAIKQK